MKIKNYITNIAEVKAAYNLADDDKKLVIEDESKIIVMVELTKKQFKKLQ
jgi:hypothetical protein